MSHLTDPSAMFDHTIHGHDCGKHLPVVSTAASVLPLVVVYLITWTTSREKCVNVGGKKCLILFSVLSFSADAENRKII